MTTSKLADRVLTGVFLWCVVWLVGGGFCLVGVCISRLAPSLIGPALRWWAGGLVASVGIGFCVALVVHMLSSDEGQREGDEPQIRGRRDK